jgi:hypothetical protein
VEGAHGFGDAATGFDDFFVAAGGFLVPLPGVLEGGDLGGGAGTGINFPGICLFFYRRGRCSPGGS